jgi:hypothetical protein
VRTLPARLLDLVSVLAFVAIGRSNHGESESLGGLANTLWPFLGGLLIGWLIVVRLRRPLASRAAGAMVGLSVLGGGVILRAVSGQGLAVSFVLVIAVFFAVVLLGWRSLAPLVVRRLDRVRG